MLLNPLLLLGLPAALCLSPDAIAADYMDTSTRLMQGFNATKHQLLASCPALPPTSDDSSPWYTYLTPYYLARYLILKANYASATEAYRAQIHHFDARAKLGDAHAVAQLALGASATDYRDLFSKYYQTTLAWFRHDVDETWEKYNNKCV